MANTYVDFDAVPIRLSKFTHVFLKGSDIALYHSLSQEIVFLHSDLYPLVEILKGGCTPEILYGRLPQYRVETLKPLLNELTKLGLVIDVDFNEAEQLQELQKAYLGGISIQIMYLLLTDNCNLACSYCFIEKALPEGYQHAVMSKSTAASALDLFSKSLQGNPSTNQESGPILIFYGGEPLLNLDTLSFVLSRVREMQSMNDLPQNLNLEMVTNGTLLTPEIVDLLLEYNVNVGVSIDGPANTHDTHRCYPSGKGSFKDALRGYNLLRSKCAPVGISLTLGPHNVDQAPEIVEWLIDDFQINELGLNILLDTPGKPYSTANEIYSHKAAESVIACFEIVREKGVYEDRMMRKVKSFTSGSVYASDCGAIGNQIVVAPDGQVGVCHAYVGSRKFFSSKDISKIDVFTDPIFLEWSKRSPLNMPQCNDCEALGICGGGCPYSAALQRGSIWAIDERFCVHAKETLHWLIWELRQSKPS
jgi:uncharacterized protein